MMKLTPIPQKGARSTKESGKKRKRTKEKTEGGTKRKKSRHDPSLRARRQKTSIMDLPDWFLVDVFMLEKNFNFPRCSAWIGRALSHRYTLRRLIAAAFEPTWDMWFGCAAQEVDGYQNLPTSTRYTWLGDGERFGGDPKLQNEILAQHWLTVDRMLQAQQIWLDARLKRGRPVHYRVPLPPVLHKTQDCASRSIGFEGFLRDANFSVKEQFELEFNAILADREVDALFPSSYPVMLEVHRDTHFPDWLISGPWYGDDVKLLFWLGRAGAVMSVNQSWELVIEGLDCMAVTARTHKPGTTFTDRARRQVSQVVRLFEIFRIWDKLPLEHFFRYVHTHDLGWLREVLVKRTRIGEYLGHSMADNPFEDRTTDF